MPNSATNSTRTDDKPYTNAELADRLDAFDFEGWDVSMRELSQIQGLMGLAAEALRRSPGQSPTNSTGNDVAALAARIRLWAKHYSYIDCANLVDVSLEAAGFIERHYGQSVRVEDMDIIGKRAPGDEHLGRAWWSGGSWLQPGEVIAVFKLPHATGEG